jgi:hypothetical protein
MPRPRRCRRIFREPQIRCFRPETIDEIELEDVEITLDELESVRLSDYQKIHQKKAAEMMGISQPTFHRIITSAREKVATALVEGKIIKIKGGNYITDKRRCKCRACDFEWYSPEKKHENCPECGSADIFVMFQDGKKSSIGQPGFGVRRSFGGPGRGIGMPLVCKCPNCGYKTEKIQGVPCRTQKCPKCGKPLCGAN